ncbi:MAG: flavodoxin [Deltaproteobacteria bacterium]|jgi:flavodoxin|nr:flavodoxin [Deltaproteobacteria bacterium]
MNNPAESEKAEKKGVFKRNLVKMLAVGFIAVMAAPAPPAGAATNAGGKKVLTVFYSRTGNTRDLAGIIQAGVGGDIVELETVDPYPEAYRASTEQAKKELEANYFPPLKNGIESIAQYDVIFVGSPIWWGTFAAPVRGFLAGHDFTGKTVVPFITHEGSGLGKSMADLKALCPGATVLPGLAVRGGRAGSAQNEVAEWLKSIRLGD